MDMMTSLSLPPGFGFHPTDAELVCHYLKSKILGYKMELEIIPEVDIYKHEPWSLPGKSLIPSRDCKWHFFTPRDKKYPNGARRNRATEAGFWKATGKDRKISYKRRIVGTKKTLVFHRGRAPSGERTDWIMHEYHLDKKECESAPDGHDAFVLCRVTKKNAGVSQEEILETQVENSDGSLEETIVFNMAPRNGQNHLEGNKGVADETPTTPFNIRDGFTSDERQPSSVPDTDPGILPALCEPKSEHLMVPASKPSTSLNVQDFPEMDYLELPTNEELWLSEFNFCKILETPDKSHIPDSQTIGSLFEEEHNILEEMLRIASEASNWPSTVRDDLSPSSDVTVQGNMEETARIWDPTNTKDSVNFISRNEAGFGVIRESGEENMRTWESTVSGYLLDGRGKEIHRTQKPINSMSSVGWVDRNGTGFEVGGNGEENKTTQNAITTAGYSNETGICRRTRHDKSQVGECSHHKIRLQINKMQSGVSRSVETYTYDQSIQIVEKTFSSDLGYDLQGQGILNKKCSIGIKDLHGSEGSNAVSDLDHTATEFRHKPKPGRPSKAPQSATQFEPSVSRRRLSALLETGEYSGDVCDEKEQVKGIFRHVYTFFRKCSSTCSNCLISAGCALGTSSLVLYFMLRHAWRFPR